MKAKKGYIYVNTDSKRGKKNSSETCVSRFAYLLPYILLRLRVVRGRLPNGDLETVLTSLSRDEFNTEKVMELYKLRLREGIFSFILNNDFVFIGVIRFLL